jgi:radical SAM protein with 4Fe4S-binding SPASM domain
MVQSAWECILNIPKDYDVNICLTDSGEPFLFSRLSELLSILSTKRVTLEILTNGLLLDEDHIKLIANFPFELKIMISLDAVDLRLSSIRNCGKFQAKRILKNVSNIKESFTKLGANNVQLIANTLILRQNSDHLSNVVSFASNHGFDEVHLFHPIILFKEISHYSLITEPEIWKTAIQQCREVANKLNLVIVYPSTDASPMPDKAPTCPFCWSSTWVMADGKVKPCCKPGSPVLGDLTKESLQSVWLGENYNKFRETMLSDELPSPCVRCFFRWESVGIILPEAYQIWDDEATVSELLARKSREI